MRRVRTQAGDVRAIAPIAALLLLGLAAGAVHGHDLETSSSCVSCVLASTPGEQVAPVGVDLTQDEAGPVRIETRRAVDPPRRTSLGSRGPPAAR